MRPPERVTRTSVGGLRPGSARTSPRKNGADDVELAVPERQRLRVALDELGVETLGVAPPAGPVEERRDVVDADDLATAAGRGQGRIAAAGRDVEDVLGRVDVERLDEQLRHDLDLGPDHVVVAARPGRLLTALDGGEVRRGRRRGGSGRGGRGECVHGSPFWTRR
jgi:hypothetical protein